MNGPDPIRARWRELIDRHLLDELSNDESRELEAALAAYRDEWLAELRRARETGDLSRLDGLEAALEAKRTALLGDPSKLEEFHRFERASRGVRQRVTSPEGRSWSGVAWN